MKQNLIDWVRDHDDRWSFVALYVGGAIILSVFTNLFWVSMLMAGNFLLKVYRNRLVGKPYPVLSSLWQIKLDIALILFSLALGLYTGELIAALGLSQAARAGQAVRGLQMATRFGLIERALKVVLMTVDDFARLVGAIAKALRNKKNATVRITSEMVPEPEADEPDRPWEKWGKGDVFTFLFGGICVTLILLAPTLTGLDPAVVVTHIVTELSP